VRGSISHAHKSHAKKSRRGRPRVLGEEDVALVWDLVRAGKADHEIAAILGVSRATVWAFRRLHCIPSGPGCGGPRPGAGRKPGSSAKQQRTPRRLVIGDEAMVVWHRQHYVTTAHGVLCGDGMVSASGRPGCPRSFRPRPALGGRAGRRGHGGGFVDPTARAAFAALQRQ
jgi:hypothetical protein